MKTANKNIKIDITISLMFKKVKKTINMFKDDMKDHNKISRDEISMI